MQEILTYIVIIAAATYLARKVYQSFFSKKEACETCAFSKIGAEKIK